MGLFINLKKAASKIQDAFLSKVNGIFRKRVPAVSVSVKKEIVDALISSEFYKEVIGGTKLRGALGFVAGTESEIMDSVIDTIADSLEVRLEEFRSSGNNISGGLVISLLPDVYDKILNNPDALTVGRADVPWLEWTLLRGSKPVVLTHRIVYGNWGRSGEAIMMKGGKFAIVPAEFQGTSIDNWVTRALFDNIKEIQDAIERSLNV
jgi:hypothetical protein